MSADYNFSNKKTIFPKVVVYKSLLKDVDKLFETVKKTESYTEKTHLFSPWNNWLGNWKGRATQIDGSEHEEILGEDEDAAMQREFFTNVFEAFKLSSEDFLKEYRKTDGWPKFLTNWDDKKTWDSAGISLLRYDGPAEGQSQDSLAMNYHTDTNQDDLESQDTKLVITVTMYLNDDYEGGEISFYEENEGRVYNYKPKAGDVTVFPSSLPYWHGVLPFTGNPRYLLRMFVVYEYEGSEEWLANRDKYGEELWAEMEQKRLHESWENGNHLRHIEYDLSKEPHMKFKTFFVAEPPIVVE